MARKTIRVSDKSGAEIPGGKGATVRITFADARKGSRELDLTDEEAEALGGRSSGPPRTKTERRWSLDSSRGSGVWTRKRPPVQG